MNRAGRHKYRITRSQAQILIPENELASARLNDVDLVAFVRLLRIRIDRRVVPERHRSMLESDRVAFSVRPLVRRKAGNLRQQFVE